MAPMLAVAIPFPKLLHTPPVTMINLGSVFFPANRSRRAVDEDWFPDGFFFFFVGSFFREFIERNGQSYGGSPLRSLLKTTMMASNFCLLRLFAFNENILTLQRISLYPSSTAWGTWCSNALLLRYHTLLQILA